MLASRPMRSFSFLVDLLLPCPAVARSRHWVGTYLLAFGRLIGVTWHTTLLSSHEVGRVLKGSFSHKDAAG